MNSVVPTLVGWGVVLFEEIRTRIKSALEQRHAVAEYMSKSVTKKEDPDHERAL